MQPDQFVVELAFDEDAGVWFVENSNVIGLSGEAQTLDALMDRLPVLINEMVQENYHGPTPASVRVTASKRIRILEAA